MHHKAANNPDQAETNPLENVNVQIKCANKLHPRLETGLWIIGVLSWIFVAYQIVHALSV
jgi:hypothetical protein